MNNIVLAASDELRVVFDYRLDRWGHTIEVRRDDQWVAAFTSIEGDSADDWPPSPAFQHVHLQSFAPHGPTALLVGKAGSSHWSAAIEADREAATLRFDIACRVGGEPRFLGSRYTTATDAHTADSVWPHFESMALNDGFDRSLTSDEEQLSIRILNLSETRPRTIRWKYVVAIA